MTETPLIKKLRILPDQKILILHAPQGYLESLGEFPPGIEADTQVKDTYDLVQVFFTQSAALEDEIDGLKAVLKDTGILWLCYPKQRAGQETDLNRDILRTKMTPFGLKAVSLVSVDSTWSAMRFKRV